MRLSMGLQPEGTPDAMHRIFGYTRRLRHGTHRPLGRLVGTLFECLVYDLGHLLILNRSRRSRPQFVIQADQAAVEIPLAPFSHGGTIHAKRLANRTIGLAIGGQQDNLGTAHQPMG